VDQNVENGKGHTNTDTNNKINKLISHNKEESVNES